MNPERKGRVLPVTNTKGLRRYQPTVLDVLLVVAAIFFLTLALMQLPKGPMPDNPSLPPPQPSSAVF